MIPYRYCGPSMLLLVGGVELPVIVIETLADAVKNILQRRMTEHDSIDGKRADHSCFEVGQGGYKLFFAAVWLEPGRAVRFSGLNSSCRAWPSLSSRSLMTDPDH
jgi:hypothetical protein